MISFKDYMNLDEALSAPYSFIGGISRNSEWGKPQLSKSRGKVGMVAEFQTEAGEKYDIYAIRSGYTKAEREEQAKQKAANAEYRELGLRKRVFRKEGGGIYEVHFNRKAWNKEKKEYDHDSSISGTGDAFRVLATVMEFIKELEWTKKPTIISIKSKTEEKSRGDLYTKMAGRYASKLGYKVFKTVVGPKMTRIELRRT